MTVERIANGRAQIWVQPEIEPEASVIQIGRTAMPVPDNDDDPGPDSPAAAAAAASIAASAGGRPFIPRVYPGL